MRLLLAEDNPSDVGMIRMIIGDLRPGLTLYLARDGPEVLEKLGTGSAHPEIDLVLLDINMPKMTGLEVLKALQGSQPPPIVVLTSSFEVCRDQALQLGAVDCRVKPLDFKEYETILREIADRWLPLAISWYTARSPNTPGCYQCQVLLEPGTEGLPLKRAYSVAGCTR